MITRVSSVIRPKGSDLIFDHPYNADSVSANRSRRRVMLSVQNTQFRLACQHAHRGLSGQPGALLVEDLLPQDVCVPTVLGEFAQYVEVHPAQRERAAPVAVGSVV